jgi:hypothetical protein
MQLKQGTGSRCSLLLSLSRYFLNLAARAASLDAQKRGSLNPSTHTWCTLKVFQERDLLLEAEIASVEQLSKALESVAKAEWYSASANASDAASLARLDLAEGSKMGAAKPSSSDRHLMDCLHTWKVNRDPDADISPVPRPGFSRISRQMLPGISRVPVPFAFAS